MSPDAIPFALTIHRRMLDPRLPRRRLVQRCGAHLDGLFVAITHHNRWCSK
jgi:hypothetical protein